MASLIELEKDEQILQDFYRILGEELERIRETRVPEVKSKLLKELQVKMFQTTLKLSFPGVKPH